jgi:putative DeoR family transcriptional regulator (stage III sporulation protein D)
VTLELCLVNKRLFDSVSEILQTNKQERHLRGGAATREKYRRKKEQAKAL